MEVDICGFPTKLSAAMNPIYLDNQATTPLAPEVLDAMLPWLKDGFGNPHSPHLMGRRAAAAVEVPRTSLRHQRTQTRTRPA